MSQAAPVARSGYALGGSDYRASHMRDSSPNWLDLSQPATLRLEASLNGSRRAAPCDRMASARDA